MHMKRGGRGGLGGERGEENREEVKKRDRHRDE